MSSRRKREAPRSGQKAHADTGSLDINRAYSVPQFARFIGCGDVAAWNLVTSGKVPSLRIGRRRIITGHNIDAFLRGEYGNAFEVRA